MRSIEEIKRDIIRASTLGTQAQLDKHWLEWLRAIAQDVEPDRLEELCQAEREGRCVVLPCKVGDTVYKLLYTHGCSICPNNHVGKCRFDGKDVKCTEPISSIREEQFDFNIYNFATRALKRGYFLTREAAEAALKGAQG